MAEGRGVHEQLRAALCADSWVSVDHGPVVWTDPYDRRSYCAECRPGHDIGYYVCPECTSAPVYPDSCPVCWDSECGGCRCPKCEAVLVGRVTEEPTKEDG